MFTMELYSRDSSSGESLPGQVNDAYECPTGNSRDGGRDAAMGFVPLADANTIHPMKSLPDSQSCPDLSPITNLHENTDEHVELSGDSNGNVVKRSEGSSEGNRKSFWITIRAAGKLRTASKRREVDSFLEKFTTNRHYNTSVENTDAENNYITAESDGLMGTDDSSEGPELVTSQEGDFLFYWLGVMMFVNLYNLWFLVAREAWSEIQLSAQTVWFIFDYCCDLTFILDILVQFRTGYLEHGLLVTESRRLAKHYMASPYFAVDIIALLPTDLLYFAVGVHPLLRFPRFLKIYRATQFYYKVETSSPHPNSLRLLNLVHILLLLTHWFAAVFYILGTLSGIEEGLWVYQSWNLTGNDTALRYLTAFYWSTITLTTIGDIPMPTSTLEFILQIIGYMIGVFIFATIVGQVGTVIDNRNIVRLEFERHVDHTKKYMRINKVPKDVQHTILRWYDYTWSSGQMGGKGDVNTLSLLPAKLRTELALHVNLNTLKKVTFFQECPPEFLHELVLKMRFLVITPGDLIIRRGQVAREMFIISDGLLEVIGDDGLVLATLETGDFFGEIGILNLDGASSNRRVADVRSVGYSELFTLVKEDILGLLKDYPQAERVLHNEGKKRLRRNGKLREASSAGTTRNSAIEKMRQSGIYRSPSAGRKRARPNSLGGRPSTPLPPLLPTELMPAGPTIPTIQVRKESDPTSGDLDTRGDLARDVLQSIEDIITEKLEKVNSDNEQLRMRNEQLEAQIRKLQEMNEKKTDELMDLRKTVKALKTQTVQTLAESTF